MRSVRLRSVSLAVLGTLLTVVWNVPAAGGPDPDELARVVQAIENLNALRSGLAGTFEGRQEPADQTTFQQVCKPVGMQAKRLAQTNGWQVIQMAEKYRNPAHQLDPEGRSAYRLLEVNKRLMGLWTRTELEGQVGTRYFRRITVESSCLACHGAKKNRPAFIKKTYPNDRAYDFQEGDLRGIYAVFVPDQK